MAKLYRMVCEEETLPVPEEALAQAIDAREELARGLSKEQRTLLNAYLEAECVRKDEEMRALFHTAFTMGLRLGEEAFRKER